MNIQHKKKIKELLLIIKDQKRVIKNKQECIRRRNHFVSNLKLSKNVENPKSKIIKLLKKRIFRLLKINKDKINRSRCLDSKIVYIENVEDKVEDLDMNKTHKHFPVNMRMLAYTCLKNNAPSTGIPDIIKRCVKLFNINVNNIPHRSTIENMSLELGILADYITAEFMIQNKNLTLGFDATTQEGVHVNAVNINSKDKGYLVSVEELAGGTADDYTDHIYKSINHIAHIYSYLKNLPFIDIKNKIINNISNTMSDRAIVNSKTIHNLNECWNKTLYDLKCHLHPLDTIASTSRTTLKKIQVMEGVVYGRDCVAANLVLQIGKLRYKDGKGDPKAFTAALKNKSLSLSLLPRYRGNRLHILFKTCEILIINKRYYRYFRK